MTTLTRKLLTIAVLILPAGWLARAGDIPTPAAPGAPATKSIDELVSSLAAYYHELDHLPGLRFKYTMRCNIKHPNSNVAFAWNDVKSEVKHKGDMDYMDVHMRDDAGKFPVDMKFSWDGSIGRWRDADKIFSLWQNYVDRQVTYSFFWRLFAREREIKIYNQHCTGWLKTVTERYALPGALVDYKSEFKLRPKLEVVDGAPCHVLERPGRDVLWIDAARGSCLMRREYFREKEGVRLETVVFGSLKSLRPDFWFPTKASLDVYTTPSDPKEIREKVAYHQDFNVESVDVKPLDDSDFKAVQPSPGMMIYDDHTQSHFKWQPDGKTPFDQTIAESREWTNDSKRFRLLLKISVVILLTISLVVVFRRSGFITRQT